MVDKLETPARAILVIEDDFAIRGLLGLTMRNAGYVVWETATGEEGIEVFRQHRDSIGLIILDLGLPGIDGLDTARALRALKPGIGLAFTTGGSTLTQLAEMSALNPRGTFGKPFSFLWVLEQVKGILGPVPP